MKNITRRVVTSLLTICMLAGLSLPNIYADTNLLISTNKKISVSLEVKGDPEMGTLYKEELEVEVGTSAFDLIKMIADEEVIQLDYDQEWLYVTGINGLSAMDKGPNSGWLYKVNQASPNVGAGDFILKDTDQVLFTYTLDYTKDYTDRLDVSAWALESIDKAVELGMISQDETGKINPKTNITRAEFVTLLLVAIGEEPDEAFKGTFTDVPEDASYARVVEKAAALGLVNGYDTGNFLPGQGISRQDMAVILTSAFLKGELEDNKPDVSDLANISPYAVRSVAYAIDKGFMTGVGNKAFDPKGPVTREMAIAIIIRIVESK